MWEVNRWGCGLCAQRWMFRCRWVKGGSLRAWTRFPTGGPTQEKTRFWWLNGTTMIDSPWANQRSNYNSWFHSPLNREVISCRWGQLRRTNTTHSQHLLGWPVFKEPKHQNPHMWHQNLQICCFLLSLFLLQYSSKIPHKNLLKSSVVSENSPHTRRANLFGGNV